MESSEMHLKILLPFKVFAESQDVKRIVAETSNGSFGILPNRLDCTAALIPGILTIETQGEGEKFIAIDDGVLVKTGVDVFISVRNAIGGADLGKLHQAVKEQFLKTDKTEIDIRATLAKLESNFIKGIVQLGKK